MELEYMALSDVKISSNCMKTILSRITSSLNPPSCSSSHQQSNSTWHLWQPYQISRSQTYRCTLSYCATLYIWWQNPDRLHSLSTPIGGSFYQSARNNEALTILPHDRSTQQLWGIWLKRCNKTLCTTPSSVFHKRRFFSEYAALQRVSHNQPSNWYL